MRDAIDVIDALIRDTAEQANQAALAVRSFHGIGAETGVGIRLLALQDARDALVTAGLRAHERATASDETQGTPEEGA